MLRPPLNSETRQFLFLRIGDVNIPVQDHHGFPGLADKSFDVILRVIVNLRLRRALKDDNIPPIGFGNQVHVLQNQNPVAVPDAGSRLGRTRAGLPGDSECTVWAIGIENPVDFRGDNQLVFFLARTDIHLPKIATSIAIELHVRAQERRCH